MKLHQAISSTIAQSFVAIIAIDYTIVLEPLLETAVCYSNFSVSKVSSYSQNANPDAMCLSQEAHSSNSFCTDRSRRA